MSRQEAKSTPECSDSEHRYHDLYENMPVMYFEMDQQAKVLSVNRFGAQQLGYEPHELIGSSVLSVFHEDDRAAVDGHFQSLIESRGMASWEFRKRRKDGSILWVRETARTLETEPGQLEVMVVCQDITSRKRAEEERRDAERLVRKLSLQLGEAQERERRRIAVHLHDGVGQSLVLAHIKLAELGENGGSKDELQEVKHLLQQAIEDTRSLTFELASPVLYELGLPDALQSICDRQESMGETRYEFSCKGDVESLTERLAVPFYRIAKELAFNVGKHAQAKRAQILLERSEDRLQLTVQDDGKGFDPATVHVPGPGHAGIGLFSIEQRVDLLGGQLEIQSEPGRGSRVSVSVELRPVPSETGH